MAFYIDAQTVGYLRQQVEEQFPSDQFSSVFVGGQEYWEGTSHRSLVLVMGRRTKAEIDESTEYKIRLGLDRERLVDVEDITVKQDPYDGSNLISGSIKGNARRGDYTIRMSEGRARLIIVEPFGATFRASDAPLTEISLH